MKIIHIVAGLPVSGGGLSELVPKFASEAARRGHDVTLVTRAYASEALSIATAEAVNAGVKLVRFSPSFPKCIYFSLKMASGLDALVKTADVVHVHGNWTFPVWFACLCAVRHRRILVMSPHGSFDPVRLAYSSWKKRLVAPLDLWCLKHADVIHATADCEVTWINDFCGCNAKTVMIPNGVAMSLHEPVRRVAAEKYRALYLGRLHPLKGLDLLLKAWSKCDSSARAGWKLSVAGPDETNLLDGLRKTAKALGVADSVEFLPPSYGDDKWALLCSADCLILPTRSENFGIVVAEALMCGIPVICTKGAPWKGLIDNKCGWWCEIDVTELSDSICEMMSLSDEARHEMGMRGRNWVRENFGWASVSEKMLTAYNGVRGS